MGELIRYLIDKLKSRPATAEALLIAAILTAAFSVAQYVETKPEAIASLSNCYFQATVIIVLSIWAASLCWRYAKVQTLRIIATLTFLGIGMLGAVAVIQASHIKPLKLRILFDESVNMPPATMAKLVSLLRSELFRIEISDRALTINTSAMGEITDDEARSALHAQELLRTDNKPDKPLPVLITGKMLKDPQWSKLLMISWDDAVVISIWRIGSEASLSDAIVRRYVATSVAFESLVSYALKHKKAILEDRSPELYKGCLHDFHRTRRTYVVQSQNPVLCEAEESTIKAIFGGATVKALKKIFDQISKDA